MYDVCIIGAGATGAAAAYWLARKNVKVVLVDKEADASFGVSKANSGIVHGGFHYSVSKTLKGKLELEGNRMFPAMAKELGFPYNQCGIIVVAYSEEQLAEVKKLYDRGVENGVEGMEFCDSKRMYELEPKLCEGCLGGVYAPQGGVVEPYAYVFSLVEDAERNGVIFERNFEVVSAEYQDNAWKMKSASGKELTAKYVINACGLFADKVSAIFGGEEFEILARKGEEYLLDRLSPAYPTRVVFPVPTPTSKGVLVIPTAGGTTMVGPTAHIVPDKEDTDTTAPDREEIFALAQHMVQGVTKRDLIAAFAGLRPALAGGDFMIKISEKAPAFIQASGIQSPGLTASPAVGKMLVSLLEEAGLKMEDKAEIAPVPPKRRLREMSAEEVDALYQKDPAWTNIICRCEKISEAEIVDAVRHGHVTLDAVKLHTRAGMGRCQGGFCSAKIWAIISRETGIPIEELTKRGKKSNFFNGSVANVAFKGDSYETK
ncbi:MAG: NAD(P)/FAD-dependent oxidoreductase [Lentisphaerae bacterium]|nr:NAD(P)/FAD-dependent oxidoreductase [Lentisphaerota bacterium]